MTKKLGNIDYTREEYLNFTGIFETPSEDITDFAGKMSFEIIDTKDIDVSSEEAEDEIEAGAFEDAENDLNSKNQMIEDIQENLEKI